MNKTSTVILRLEPELRERIDQGARELGITRSEYIRRLIASIPVEGKIEDGRVIEHGKLARPESLP